MSKRDFIFLSYASEDETSVRKIYHGLNKRNLEVWFDKEDLGTGMWKPQITRAIAHSRYFIFFLSKASLKKTSLEKPGFADHELQTAWEIAVNQPEDEFTIVPVKLEDCDRGDNRLSSYQQFDLFEDDNFESGLDKLAVNLGGNSLSDLKIKDDRTDDEKLTDSVIGKSTTAYLSGEYSLSLKLVESIIDIKPENYRAWYNKGLSLHGLGRKYEAILAFGKVVEHNPQDYRAWYNKGLALYELGKMSEAIDAFNKTIEISHDFTGAWENKISALRALGKYEDASETSSGLISIYEKQIEEAKASYYDDVETWSNYAQSESMLGHHSESMIDYYDTEVRVSHQGYQQRVKELQTKIKPYQEKITTQLKKLKNCTDRF